MRFKPKSHSVRHVTSRHDTTRSTSRAQAFWICWACRTARLDTLVSTRSTRQTCRVVSRRDVTSRVWYGLYWVSERGLYFKVHSIDNVGFGMVAAIVSDCQLMFFVVLCRCRRWTWRCCPLFSWTVWLAVSSLSEVYRPVTELFYKCELSVINMSNALCYFHVSCCFYFFFDILRSIFWFYFYVIVIFIVFV